jgi:hypothetical protein
MKIRTTLKETTRCQSPAVFSETLVRVEVSSAAYGSIHRQAPLQVMDSAAD